MASAPHHSADCLLELPTLFKEVMAGVIICHVCLIPTEVKAEHLRMAE